MKTKRIVTDCIDILCNLFFFVSNKILLLPQLLKKSVIYTCYLFDIFIDHF